MVYARAQDFNKKSIKGYLRYKTITPQNVPSETLGEEFFCFLEKPCSVREIFKFFVFLTIPWFTKSMTIWSVLVECIFECIFWTITHRPNRQLTDVSKGNILLIFWTIWRTGAKFQALFNLAACSNYSTTNYVKFPVFQRVNKGELKMVNINYQKLTDLVIL